MTEGDAAAGAVEGDDCFPVAFQSSDFIAHLEQLDPLYGPQPGRAIKPVCSRGQQFDIVAQRALVALQREDGVGLLIRQTQPQRRHIGRRSGTTSGASY